MPEFVRPQERALYYPKILGYLFEKEEDDAENAGDFVEDLKKARRTPIPDDIAGGDSEDCPGDFARGP